MHSLPPKKIFYGLEAVLYIAYNSGAGPISGKDLAVRQNLPPRYLEQLMQKLVRAGILRGIRGPNGGYLLARERRRITIGEVHDILLDDKEDYTRHTTALGKQVVLPVWNQAQQHMLAQLHETSLEDLCEKATDANIKKEHASHMDFVI